MFPPGRARLATTPLSTGSPIAPMTTGIVVRARLAASAAGVPPVTMTSTLSRISSASRSSSRSIFPPAARYSRTKLRPSM